MSCAGWPSYITRSARPGTRSKLPLCTTCPPTSPTSSPACWQTTISRRPDPIAMTGTMTLSYRVIPKSSGGAPGMAVTRGGGATRRATEAGMKLRTSSTRRTTPPRRPGLLPGELDGGPPMASHRAAPHEPRFEERVEHLARVEARHVAVLDDLAHRTIAVDHLEQPLLVLGQAIQFRCVDRHAVGLQHRFEAAQARLDD